MKPKSKPTPKTAGKFDIKVEFLMTLAPDKDGCTTEIVFSIPDHPGVATSDKTKRLALDRVGQMCQAVLTHPDGFPA